MGADGIRGHRVELGEIEVRLDEHPDVVRSVVALVEPDGSSRLAAYVELHRGRQLDPSALRDHVATRLPDVMVPDDATISHAADWIKAQVDDGRVVLIDFPHTEMKTLGFVTRVMREAGTGRELAAVYVPTTPNPTSGYLEIVPVEKITPTDWNVDQAMSFIISGGAVAPDTIPFTPPAAPQPGAGA